MAGRFMSFFAVVALVLMPSDGDIALAKNGEQSEEIVFPRAEPATLGIDKAALERLA